MYMYMYVYIHQQSHFQNCSKIYRHQKTAMNYQCANRIS